jgi:hypothetical protein
MKQRNTAGGEAQKTAQTASNVAETAGLDAQYVELIEMVWTCERQWNQDDRIDAAIKYGRS